MMPVVLTMVKEVLWSDDFGGERVVEDVTSQRRMCATDWGLNH